MRELSCPLIAAPRAVIVGYGPVGACRAETLARRGCRLAIISSDVQSRCSAEADHPSAWIAGSAEELDAGGYDWRECLTVVTIPVASRCQMFHQLAYYGVRRMAFETPLAESPLERANMLKRAAREGISIRLNPPAIRIVNAFSSQTMTAGVSSWALDFEVTV